MSPSRQSRIGITSAAVIPIFAVGPSVVTVASHRVWMPINRAGVISGTSHRGQSLIDGYPCRHPRGATRSLGLSYRPSIGGISAEACTSLSPHLGLTQCERGTALWPGNRIRPGRDAAARRRPTNSRMGRPAARWEGRLRPGSTGEPGPRLSKAWTPSLVHAKQSGDGRSIVGRVWRWKQTAQSPSVPMSRSGRRCHSASLTAPAASWPSSTSQRASASRTERSRCIPNEAKNRSSSPATSRAPCDSTSKAFPDPPNPSHDSFRSSETGCRTRLYAVTSRR